MFAEVDMRRLVVVEPHELGDVLHTQRAMIRRLLQDVDTLRCSEEHGYYVAVTTLENVSEGKIRHGTGSVIFWVDFKCIVFRPFVKEIVEAVVVKVNNHGFFADCGPQERILVPKKNMTGFEYRQEEVETYNSWRDSTGSEIKMNEVVRLQIVATKWDAKDRTYLAVGSLNGDLLGHLPDYGKEDSLG